MESLLPDEPHRSSIVHRLAMDCAYASVKGSLRLVKSFLEDRWTPPTLLLPARRFTPGHQAPALRLLTTVTTTTAAADFSQDPLQAASSLSADIDPMDLDDGNSFSSVGVGASR